MPALLTPLPQARAKVKHLPPSRGKAQRPTPQTANEQPQYEALAEGISEIWRGVRRDFADLRRDWLRAVGTIPAGAATRNIGTTPPDFNERDLDAAIERFMEAMAGPKPRGRQEFTAGDGGHVREANYLGHRVGSVRGAAQVGLPTPDPNLTRLQRLALNARAFDRLSADGRIRFETRLGLIKDAMMEGFSVGASPLQVVRDLAGDLDGFEAMNLRRLVRTEMAFSAEAATIEQYREAGVTQYEIIGDPTTDAACVDAQEGGPYELSDEESRPPIHPQCFCSCVPWQSE